LQKDNYTPETNRMKTLKQRKGQKKAKPKRENETYLRYNTKTKKRNKKLYEIFKNIRGKVKHFLY